MFYNGQRVLFVRDNMLGRIFAVLENGCYGFEADCGAKFTVRSSEIRAA